MAYGSCVAWQLYKMPPVLRSVVCARAKTSASFNPEIVDGGGTRSEGVFFGEFPVGRFQPLVFPKNKATSLAPAVRRSITTGIKMDRLVEPPPANRENSIAGLVRSFVNLEPLTAEREHLWHERHAIEPSLDVERSENLFLASNFHQVANF